MAVVGPTASGESTLTMLLARLWDPSDGAIHIDGRDLRTSPVRTRARGRLVAQESFLFDDTVWGNVTLGLGCAGGGRACRALRLAGVERFITELPEGYDTQIGSAAHR